VVLRRDVLLSILVALVLLRCRHFASSCLRPFTPSPLHPLTPLPLRPVVTPLPGRFTVEDTKRQRAQKRGEKGSGSNTGKPKGSRNTSKTPPQLTWQEW